MDSRTPPEATRGKIRNGGATVAPGLHLTGCTAGFSLSGRRQGAGVATYFDRQKDRAREQERRDALAAWCAETLAIERMAEDWRRQMTRKGWPPFFRPQPSPLRAGSTALLLRRIDGICRALLPEPWSPFLPWTHKVNRSRPVCAFDLFYVGAVREAWREYLRRRPALHRKVKGRPRLAARRRAPFFKVRPRTRGGGTRAPYASPRSLAIALAEIELSKDRTTITRAHDRLMRAAGHTASLDRRPK